MANYQQRGWNTAATVFERKLEESLKVMNTQGTLAGYKTTEEFVSELQKHLKITKVCKNDDLQSCFEEEITWNIINVSSKTESEIMNISALKTANDLGKNDWNTNTVGVQLNNGTSALIAYNPECRQDQFSNQITGTSCVAVLYDTSGYSKPNSSGKDVRGINSLINKCVFKSNTVCFGTAFKPTAYVWKGCNTSGETTNPDDLVFMNKTGIRYCMNSGYGTNDYWAGAVEQCGHVDKMPTMAQLAEIVNYVYNTDKIAATTDVSNLTRDDAKVSSLGFTNFTSSNAFYVWSGEENSFDAASYRNFFPTYTHWAINKRSFNYIQAVCLGD